MKIPPKIKIGGHIYEVILRDRSKEDGKSEVGTIDNKYNKIWLHSAWSKSQIETTFFIRLN